MGRYLGLVIWVFYNIKGVFLNFFKQMRFILSKKYCFAVSCLFMLMIFSMILETCTLGLILPVIGVLTRKDYLENLPILNEINFFHNISNTKLIMVGVFGLVCAYTFKVVYLLYLTFRQNKLSYNLQVDISSRLFRGYLNQQWNFYLQRNSSNLIQNIVNETSMFVGSVVSPALTLLSELFIVTGVVSLLLIFRPKETLIIFLFFGFAITMYHVLTKNKSSVWGKLRFTYDAKRMLQLKQSFACIKEVKLMSREDFFVKMYNDYSKISAEVNRKYKSMLDLPRLVFELVAVVGLASLILLLLRYESIENIFPTVALFAAVAFRLMPSMNRIISSVNSLRFSGALVNNLNNELVEFANTYIDQNVINFEFNQMIELQNVFYKYENATNFVLENINLKINKGDFIGIYGASGAGKSTLIDLILGLLKPGHGCVKIDGVDIKEHAKGWQKHIGYLSQNIYLLDDSIKRNVAFGVSDEDICENKVIEILKTAQLEEFIATLSSGIETNVGENGVRLSGGQRQRLGIARALYNNPDVLVLDEATSALDIETEQEVMRAIYNLHGMKTLIIITHRISTVRRCDRVYKMESGKLVFDENINSNYVVNV